MPNLNFAELMKNHKDFTPQRPKTIDPDNLIYNKLDTFPSREISRITHSFSKSSNKVGSSFFAEQCNLRWLGAAATATLTTQS
jgi:hypothetical protein